MPWTHSQSANNSASVTQPNIAKPAGVTAGMLLYVALFGAAQAQQWPEGWVVDGKITDGNGNTHTWGHKVAGANEPATYTWPIVAGVWTLLLETFANGSLQNYNILDEEAQSTTNATATTLVMPRPAPVLANDLVVYACAVNGSPTMTISAGATILQVVNGAATAWETPAAAGTTPSRTFTFGTTQTMRTGITACYSAIAPAAPVTHVLTGSGVQALSSPVAVEVVLTGIPAHQSIVLGTPTRYWGLGNLSFGGTHGYGRAYYLEHPDEMILIPFSTCTLLGYKLAPGITATVTELFSI